MTVTITRGAEVTRPDTTPLLSSVLDHATVVSKPDFGMRNNQGLWPSYNCLDLLVPTELCAPPEDPEVVKTFGNAEWIPAFQFAVQGGVQCSAVGLDRADQLAEVERVFRLSEGKGVEQSLLANRFVALVADPGNQNIEWAAPTDLTPVTPVDVNVALALLEGYAARVYSGVPTIHMPRAVASLLGGDKIVWKGDKAFTQLGSKVAMGGGYDPDANTGAFDLYATGEVYVERSEEFSTDAFVLPGDGSNARGFDDNTVLALAERMFRVGVDCFTAKATGTVWA